ncbi:hypothetical protein MTR_1g054930 [Medicago truncatula]|uniref:Uncharacterized protein n=1 Tax=Medicago truncatula TaxID=3880 RepID=A0A072VK43_MEDTR|nr:hypothetical protein MTR_1g054930 [Medicago truncatula]
MWMDSWLICRLIMYLQYDTKLANEVLFAGLERDLCIRYTFEFLQFLDYLDKRFDGIRIYGYLYLLN